MTNDEIARELVRLGLRPVPGMCDQDGDRVVSVDGFGNYAYCDSDGIGETEVGSFLPDLDDAATLGLVERWVRELWGDRVVRFEFDGDTLSISVFDEGDEYMVEVWHYDHSDPAEALLAAARAAKGGG